MNKLETKLNKRVGMKATTKDNMKVGMITGFTTETEGNGDVKVKYLIEFGQGRNAEMRLTEETNVVLMKEPNK